MAYQFKPKAESEMSSGFENLPPGEYPFTVMESSIVISKSDKNVGKEFIKLKLNVHGNGVDRHVYDVFADWFSEWKLKHFCEVSGLANEYARGEIDPGNNGWKGRQGYVKIKVSPARQEYEAKNEVADYLPEENQTVEALAKPDIQKIGSAVVTPVAALDNSDDVPF